MRQMVISLALALSALSAFAGDTPKGKPPSASELRDELLRRTKADQEARHAFIEWMKAHGRNGAVGLPTLGKEKQAEFAKVTERMRAVDAENTKWLKGVVEKQGWPTNAQVGKEAANAAWLLVQHADADKRFQRHCLDLMSNLPKNEVSQSNIAYLTDRVLLAEGKKQVYGTQFIRVEGKLKPRPLEDEARRKRLIEMPPPASPFCQRPYTFPSRLDLAALRSL